MVGTGLNIIKALKSLGFYAVSVEVVENFLSDFFLATIDRIWLDFNLDMIVSVLVAIVLAKILKLIQRKTNLLGILSSSIFNHFTSKK